MKLYFIFSRQQQIERDNKLKEVIPTDQPVKEKSSPNSNHIEPLSNPNLKNNAEQINIKNELSMHNDSYFRNDDR